MKRAIWAIGFLVLIAGLIPMPGMTTPEPVRQKSCQDVLRQVDSAKEQLLMDGRLPPNYRPRWRDLSEYFPEREGERTFREIFCPEGGQIFLGKPGEDVFCSIHGGVLAEPRER